MHSLIVQAQFVNRRTLITVITWLLILGLFAMLVDLLTG